MNGNFLLITLFFGILLVIILFILFYSGFYLLLRRNYLLLQKKNSDLEVTFEARVKERTSELEKSRDSVSVYAIQRFELAQELETKNNEVTRQKDFIFKQADKLKEAYDEIKKLDGFRRQMTGMIIHDLKNPINVILNLTDTAGIPEKPGNIIRQLSFEMLDLILNILEVQKFDELAMKVNEESIVLSSLIKESEEYLSYLLDNSALELTIEVPEDLNILADRHILKRVLGNLISNSVKHTPSGGKIVISASIKGEFVLIEVKDTGCGIAGEDIDKVFEMYNTVKQTDTFKNSSTGIGLTYCKLGVEASGGKIGIKSSPESGTTVWFTTKFNGFVEGSSSDPSGKADWISVNNPELTSEDIDILRPLTEQLKTVRLFEVTRILALISTNITIRNERISKWENQVGDAIFSADEKRYNQLLNI